jgi:hypothetical protein
MYSLPKNVYRERIDFSKIKSTIPIPNLIEIQKKSYERFLQMNRHSTLVSYLHQLLVLLTGNFGKPGAAYRPTAFVPLAGGSDRGGEGRRTPVTGARIIGGLTPCNVIPEEILTDHPKRFRALLVESGNPAHSLADSTRMREAIAALELVVVIDVAMSETARHAHYVLPAPSQFEKWEATFFTLEFPERPVGARPNLTLIAPLVYAPAVALGAARIFTVARGASDGVSLSSLTVCCWPWPSHWTLLQSPVICEPAGRAMPAVVLVTPHVPLVQVCT